MEHQIIKMPSLGEDVSHGAVVDIRVTAGGRVNKGDILLEVETDKVVVEVPADTEGEVVEILVTEGEKVSKGVDIIRLRAVSSQTTAETAKEPAKEVVKEEKASIVEPKAPKAEEKQAPVSMQTTSIEENIQKAEVSVSPVPTGEEDIPEEGYVKAGPSVRRMSRELGVDLTQVNGTGTRSAIQKDDVKDYVRTVMQGGPANMGAVVANNPVGSQRAKKPMPDLSEFGEVRKVETTGIQNATAENMLHSWSTIPHAWLTEKIDITDLEKSRKKFVSKVKSAGGAFTITVILAKAIAKVMRELPIFNAAYDDINGEIIYREYFDIGVAIDTEKGLVVPTLRGVDKKSLTEIAIEFTELTMRTKKRKITAKDLAGGGFTLSNLKGMSVSGIFPIINWPQTAILGVADSEWAPVLQGTPEEGIFEPRLIMPVTIGFDHRIINGGDAAKFLKMLKENLQDPMALLI